MVGESYDSFTENTAFASMSFRWQWTKLFKFQALCIKNLLSCFEIGGRRYVCKRWNSLCRSRARSLPPSLPPFLVRALSLSLSDQSVQRSEEPTVRNYCGLLASTRAHTHTLCGHAQVLAPNSTRRDSGATRTHTHTHTHTHAHTVFRDSLVGGSRGRTAHSPTGDSNTTSWGSQPRVAHTCSRFC